MFYKISILKNFAIFAGKNLGWSLFVIMLQAFRSATLLKRDSNTGVFLLILRYSLENTWDGVFRSATLIKRDFSTDVQPVNIAKYFRTAFL